VGPLREIVHELIQQRLAGTEGYEVKATVYSARVVADFSHFSLTSLSGYVDDNNRVVDDFSLYSVPSAQDYFGVNYGTYPNYAETKKFTQELRLSSKATHTLEWLLGAFYTHESTSALEGNYANNASGQRVGTLIIYDYPSTLSEYAAFADLTVHFSDRFDVQFGGRESHNSQTYNETDTGPLSQVYFGGNPYINATEQTQGNAFTYLLTPRYKISPDLMLYARFTSGYRVGGNSVNAVIDNVPPSFAPDKTTNYELGTKLDLIDHRLTVDASFFYTKWRDIQINLLLPPNYYSTIENGGDAKSEGIELAVKAKPLAGLTVAATAAYTDAELTQDFPPQSAGVGRVGDRLPYSSRFSGSFSVDQDFALMGRVAGFVGGTVSYVGDRFGEFQSQFSATSPRLQFPGYTDVDLRAGTRYESWTANLFINNAADRRGVLGGGSNGAESPYFVVYTQPRTLGLSVSKKF
jgi:outer membrane receptor protein involved in Fe transport